MKSCGIIFCVGEKRKSKKKKEEKNRSEREKRDESGVERAIYMACIYVYICTFNYISTTLEHSLSFTNLI